MLTNKHSSDPKVRSSVHPNPSRKRSFSETLLKLEEIEYRALRFGVDGKHLKRFHSETSFFIFLRRSVEDLLAAV